MKKIAFLYLDHIHHVYHSASIAFELSQLKNIEVHAFCSAKSTLTVFNRLGECYAKHRVISELIATTLFDRVKGWYRPNRLFPQARRVLKKNRRILNGYDAIVICDVNLAQLSKGECINKPYYILSDHGIIGRKMADDHHKKYLAVDLLLAYGKQLLDVLGDNVKKNKIVGYPKFDFWQHGNKPKLFDNDNPIVLYNPHFDEEQSSWYQWGYQVLDLFAKQTTFNLIFAPHIMLFSRRNTDIDVKYYQYDNILIDLKSSSLIDMTYTKTADIYLGDVSSQVNEFIYQPRSCVFLNPHQFDWQKNPYLAMWQLGDVVSDLSVLFATLKKAKHSNHYEPIQKKRLAHTFLQTKKGAGFCAAKAIESFLQ